MKSYLVTGGAGFIGSNFIKFLLKGTNDVSVVCLDKLTYAGNLKNISTELKDSRLSFIKGDIGDEDLVRKIFKDHRPQYVVNFAAESHVDRSIDNPRIFLETNILGTQNLLECARRAWCDDNGGFRGGVRFLQVSTDEVYGSLGSTGKFTEETPIDPHSPYSASKASADLMIQAYFDTYNFPAIITRCSNNYGPYQFPEKLIPLMINNILHGKDLPVYGDGTNVRDWIFVDDHCNGINLVLDKGELGEVYNIGGACEIKNIDIVKTLIDQTRAIMMQDPQRQQALHVPIGKVSYDLITFVEDRPGHDFRYAIDFKKLYRTADYQPSLGFQEGIRKTIEWYLDNLEWFDEVTSGEYTKYYEKMYGGK